MEAQIVQIGNSLGLRLPKTVLASLNLQRASRLRVETKNGEIVLTPMDVPRLNWAAAFTASPVAEAENLWADMPLVEGWE